MKPNLISDTELEPLGNLRWGTHSCLFYQTPQELIEVLVPFFQLGLRRHELCVWIVSEPLSKAAAAAALQRAEPNWERFVARGQIEILHHTEWYRRSGQFDPDQVLRAGLEKELAARQQGYEGLRITGDTSWVEPCDWEHFSRYEAAVDTELGTHRILALCTYPVGKCGPFEIIDIASKHQLALIKHAGRWQIVESLPHKQTETALRAQEQEFRAMFELSAVGEAQVDPRTGRFLRVNRKFCDLTGYAAEELLQMSFSAVTHPEDRERDKEAVGRVFAGAADSWSIEKRYLRKDGSATWVHVNGTVLRDAADHPLRSLAVILDISDQKRAEAVLRENEQRLRLALESGRMGTWSWEIEANRFTLDTLACENYGLNPSSGPFQAEQIFARIHPDDQQRLRRATTALMEGAPDWNEEFRIVRPDGQMRWVAGRGSVSRDSLNRPLQVVGVLFDISERKQAENQARHLHQRLELLLAERTALADQRAAQLRLLATELTEAEQRERNRSAQVLHDHLQPLLVAARLRLGLLDHQTPKADWPRILSETEELLVQAIDSTRSLSVELNPPVLKEEGLAAALEWLGHWMHHRHQLAIELQLDPAAEPAEEPIRFLCFQAVRELLLNVVKHAGVHRALVSMDRLQGNRMQIRVSDPGLGFDPAALRAHPRADRGFGLWSIEQRLGMVGGRLHIESQPGQGTTVTLVTLTGPPEPPRPPHAQPVETPFAAEPPALPANPPQATSLVADRPIRVLLADDHQILRECLAEVLCAQKDMEVVGQARDGLAALQLARQLQPDILVMDVSMPKLDGVEATRLITRDLPRIQVIGLSTHEQSDKAQAMRDAGAVAYLTKSGPAQLLLNAIRRCRLRTTPPLPAVPGPEAAPPPIIGHPFMLRRSS